jgi:Arc/MetJ-type ribon-helix-helix transcriptional regulator
MATAIHLDPSTIAALDAFVASGRFASRDDAIRSALDLVDEIDAADDSPLTPSEIAGIERGLADVAAGRTIPLEEVRAEMARRFSRGDRRVDRTR